MEWRYLVENKPSEPIDELTFVNLLKEGIISPTDLVWRQGIDDWISAKEAVKLIPPQPPIKVPSIILPSLIQQPEILNSKYEIMKNDQNIENSVNSTDGADIPKITARIGDIDGPGSICKYCNKKINNLFNFFSKQKSTLGFHKQCHIKYCMELWENECRDLSKNYHKLNVVTASNNCFLFKSDNVMRIGTIIFTNVGIIYLQNINSNFPKSNSNMITYAGIRSGGIAGGAVGGVIGGIKDLAAQAKARKSVMTEPNYTYDPKNLNIDISHSTDYIFRPIQEIIEVNFKTGFNTIHGGAIEICTTIDKIYWMLDKESVSIVKQALIGYL